MNPDFPQNERAKLEAKLTALLLGELHADEVAALSKAMAEDPELAALYERLKMTIELVREGSAKPAGQTAPLKLSGERREKLLASFKTVAPREFVKPRRKLDWLMPMAAAVAIMAVLAAMILPGLSKAKNKAMRVSKVQNDQIGGQTDMLPEGSFGSAVQNDFSKQPEKSKSPASTPVASVPSPNQEPPGQKIYGIQPTPAPAVSAPPPVAIVLPGIANGELENKPREKSLDVAERQPMDAGVGQMLTVTKGGNAGDTTIKYAASSDIGGALKQLERQSTNSGVLTLSSWGSGAAAKSYGLATNHWTIETYNRVGGTNLPVDREKLRAATESGQVAFNFADDAKSLSSNGTLTLTNGNPSALYAGVSRFANSVADNSGKVPILGDVPALGKTFKSESKLADQNGDFQTGLMRDDVSGLRYSYTNATVASLSANGDVVMWGAVDGTTNASAGYSLNAAGSQSSFAGSNAFSGWSSIIGGAVADNNGTHVGGTIRGEDQAEKAMRSKQDSPLMTRENQTSVDAPTAGNLTTGGFGGGGFGGGGGGFGGATTASTARRVVGGKQVELAAAANPSAVSRDSNRLGTETVKVDPNTFYRGLQNVGTISFGGATNAPAETPSPPSFAGANTPGSGRGLRYVTGLDTTSAIQLAVSNYLKSAGVDLDPAKGKSVFFNDRQGTLTVRGTEDDLELVKQAIDTLNIAPPEVTVGAKFVDVKNDSRALGFDWYLNKIATNDAAVASGGTTPGAEANARGKLPVPSTSPSNSNSNWWNVAATTRGFYDDAASTVAAGTNTTADYLSAEKQLNEAKQWRQALAMKAGQEKVDASLPRSRMVSIMDVAVVKDTDKLSLGEKIKHAFTGKVESAARIQVEQEHPDIGSLATLGNPESGYDPYFLQTEFETIKSDAVLKKAVEILSLDGGDKSKTEEAVNQLRKNLDVSAVKNTKFIEIGASSKKPEEAARIANAVAAAYKEYRAEQYDEVKYLGIKSLQDQLAQQDKKIQVAQAKVDELRKKLNIPGAMVSSDNGWPLRPEEVLKELSALRVQKESEYNQQATLLEGLKKMDHEKLRKALPIAYSDSQLNTLLSELDLAEQTLIKLEIDYTPVHPKYQNAKKAVDDLNRKIDGRMDGILLGLESQVAAAKSSLDTLSKEIKDTPKDVDDPAYLAAKAQLQKIMAQAGQAADTALPKPAVPPPTPQPEILTAQNAFSTFSLNVSDVSFKLAGASLEKGQMPEPASIRSEEFINAFDYRDPEAGPGVPIAFASERARYPFAHNRELLRFSLKTAAAGRQAGRPLNIVLLLDNSGSMERADRVRIIQEAMRVLAGQLQASDTFSIVTFARTAQLRVDGIPGNQAAAAAAEIAKLTPEGGTNLGDALDLAYQTALHHYLANGDNRVVLLTDGAANLGDVQPETLKQKVEAHRQQGVALDCFGIGWEGYNDDLLETLTRNGDGRYGFINTPEEANTEFVAQIAGALHVAASDVKVQVEFNPKRVTSYRQIGYAKHQLTKEQFRDNTVDAAEIASQEAGNALYTTEINPDGEGSIATVRVRYKVPGTAEYREQSWDVPYTGGAVALDQASPAMRLAATASAFSEWLATSPFAAEVSTDQLLKYLSGVPQVYGADARPAKLEWMIRQARSISGK